MATEEKTIVGAVNEINSKTITLEKDDTSFNGIDDTIHNELNTDNKTIIGGINEVKSQIKDIANKIGKNEDGSDIELPTTAKTIKGSITELFQNVSNGKQLIATAITDKGVTTGSDSTFQNMANNIRNIKGENVNGMVFEMNGKKYKITKDENGLKGSIVTYSISTASGNFTSSNINTTINYGDSYNTIISPKEGYDFVSATVSMGGIDITSTSVNGNIINIDNVDEDISINIKVNKSLIFYNISMSLNNSSSNNNNIFIEKNKTYYNNIIANNGYLINKVTINGEEKLVNATSYDVEIPNVPNNITINVETLKIDNYITDGLICNLVLKDGNVFDTITGNNVSSDLIEDIDITNNCFKLKPGIEIKTIDINEGFSFDSSIKSDFSKNILYPFSFNGRTGLNCIYSNSS